MCADQATERRSVLPKEVLAYPCGRPPMAEILLIEDDLHVRDMMEMMLGSFGHDVRVAIDGVEGVKLFAEQPSRLVVTDLLMPRKEGLETIREIKGLCGEVLILAISGGGLTLSPDGILEVASRLGADGVLAKPFSADQLRSALDELLAA